MTPVVEGFLLQERVMNNIKTKFTDLEDGGLQIERTQDTTVIEELNASIRAEKNEEELQKTLDGGQAVPVLNLPQIVLEDWLMRNDYTFDEWMKGKYEEVFVAWINSEECAPWRINSLEIKTKE